MFAVCKKNSFFLEKEEIFDLIRIQGYDKVVNIFITEIKSQFIQLFPDYPRLFSNKMAYRRIMVCNTK